MIFENIKRLADAKGMSIRAIENQVGLANGTIGKWRESEPSVINLNKVAQVLEVTIDELIEERTDT